MMPRFNVEIKASPDFSPEREARDTEREAEKERERKRERTSSKSSPPPFYNENYIFLKP